MDLWPVCFLIAQVYLVFETFLQIHTAKHTPMHYIAQLYLGQFFQQRSKLLGKVNFGKLRCFMREIGSVGVTTFFFKLF